MSFALRISWLKFEPKVSNFPTVIEMLKSISITKAKKENFLFLYSTLQ